MRRLRPGSLAGQLVLIVLAALIAGQSLSFLIFADERRAALRAANREQVLARTATLVRLLDETPPDLHEPILAASSSRQLRFQIGRESAVDIGENWHGRNRLARQLGELLDGNGGRPVLVDIRGDERRLENLIGFAPLDEATGRPRYWQGRRGPVGLVAAVQLGDGRWLNAETSFPTPPAWGLPNLVSLVLTAVLVGVAVVLAVRRLARPLARLAVAADALGRGEALPPLPEVGPADIRSTVRAFNRMQARLKRFVDDRTAMLAAVSHDLRTPITSLRLRAEFVEDDETRERMLDTLDEMQRMVEGTLAFAQGEAASEETRVVDLAALVESIVLDLTDLGADVAFASPGRLAYRCRPLGLRRALRNLIENAVRYGKRAQVSLASDRDGVRIVIEDEGPGIPPDMMERVFEPFVRLEGSRSRETGGIGLGLAIARSIVRGHGGDIRLENRPEGGLRVTIALPAAGDAWPAG
ncbi:ATP-binding protein [Benzoatithermus flavus]|uniref:histidine kinase n=1 Tax=Benzoatithermus flavus TaxID=3108223 RepID=A0ABU8XRQ2_9PROT